MYHLYIDGDLLSKSIIITLQSKKVSTLLS